MNTKLTLRMDDYIIERIKHFSEKHKISISKLTETLFSNIISYENDFEKNLSPITKKYKGIIANVKRTDDDIKYSYLIEKTK